MDISPFFFLSILTYRFRDACQHSRPAPPTDQNNAFRKIKSTIPHHHRDVKHDMYEKKTDEHSN